MPEDIETPTSEQTEAFAEPSGLRDAFDKASADLNLDEKEEKPELEAKETTEKSVEEKPEQTEKSQVHDWEKNYKELQGNFTRAQQAQKAKLESEFQKQLGEFKQKAEYHDRFNQELAKNPKLYEALKSAYQNVDPTLEQDPAVQLMKQWNDQMEARLRPIEQHYTSESQRLAEERQTAHETKVDTLISTSEQTAKEVFKTMFDKEMSDGELTQVLKVMHEEGITPSKSTARMIVKDIFHDKYIETTKQKALASNLAKKTIGSKMSTVDVSKGKSTNDRMSLKDAFEAASNQ